MCAGRHPEAEITAPDPGSHTALVVPLSSHHCQPTCTCTPSLVLACVGGTCLGPWIHSWSPTRCPFFLSSGCSAQTPDIHLRFQRGRHTHVSVKFLKSFSVLPVGRQTRITVQGALTSWCKVAGTVALGLWEFPVAIPDNLETSGVPSHISMN